MSLNIISKFQNNLHGRSSIKSFKRFSLSRLLIIYSGWLKIIGLFCVIFTILWITLHTPYEKGIIRGKNGVRSSIKVEIAYSHASQSKGLSYRRSLCNNCGMLFAYRHPMKLSFWMKNTYIPLDIAFLDKDMKIKEIIYNLQPLSTEITRSASRMSYALEMPSGYFESNKISIGDRLIIETK